MWRSLYSGISGLRNHQSSMDVIGNNIANVNTTAFKSSRMTFADAMSKTITNGKGPTGSLGGKDPMQIGIGMKISSIDTNFNQGVMQTTNMSTDLALEGEGFFVASDGVSNSYTRAGAFQIDAEGNLLSQGGGLFIQGKVADAEGNIPSGGTIGNIQIPFGQKSPANATSEIKYHCNLDASANAEENIWAADYGMAATTVSGTAVDVSSAAAGNTFTVAVNGGGAETVTIPASAATPTNVSELVTVLNQALRENSVLSNEVEVVANAAGDGVNFITTDTGGANTSIAVTSGTVDFGAAAINITTLSGTGTEGTTLINNLPITTSDLSDGDTITISGTNPDGSEVNAVFTYGAANDGTTVTDLLNQINSAFTGSTATLNSNGEIVLTDAVRGISDSTISLSFTNSNPTLDTSAISLPSFGLDQAGVDAGSHTASIFVYDSLGKKHTVEMTFTKNQADDNYWDWEASVDGGDTVITAGDRGFVTFNNDGSIANMESQPTNSQLTFDAGGGASTMEIDLFGGDSGSFSGITQYNSPFTTIAYEQDGFTMGLLQNIYFDDNGKIYGEYSNGQNQAIAQVSLAKFNNNNGLVKDGNNFYKESVNSGSAELGFAGQTFNSAVRSGYLEASNVDLTTELTNMIVTQRGFQANTKVITTADSMISELIMKVKR